MRPWIIQAAQACVRLKGVVLGDSEKRGAQRREGSPDAGSCCLTGRTKTISLRSVESGIYLAYLVMSALQYEPASCGR